MENEKEFIKLVRAAGETRVAIVAMISMANNEEDRAKLTRALNAANEVILRLDNIQFPGMWTEEECKGA